VKSFNTILIIEHNKTERSNLRNALECHNFLVLESANGNRSLEILNQHNVDIILLNPNASAGCDLDYILEIKKLTEVPLIVLSSNQCQKKALKIYDYSADDIVQKPYNTRVLNAKLQCYLRRNNYDSHVEYQKCETKLKFSKWIICPTKFQIFDTHGTSANLSIQEFHILEFMINHANRAINRDELSEVIRKENYIPSPRAIDVKITRIRKKINDDAVNPSIIQTIRGAGYLFNKDAIF